jgi:hypothetical protein
MPRLEGKYGLDAILKLKREEIAHFCESMWDEDNLENQLEVDWIGRKPFCEFLDIGESTLSGWLKESRTPRYAKVAYGLALIVSRLQREISKTTGESSGLRIIKSGDHYQLCQFRQSEHGVKVGTVVADGISTWQIAVEFANSPTAYWLLGETSNYSRDFAQGLRDGGEGHWPLEELNEETTSLLDLVWKSKNENVSRTANGEIETTGLDDALEAPASVASHPPRK